jgi:protoporphyrin/coproporphyrin ferrochelatase
VPLREDGRVPGYDALLVLSFGGPEGPDDVMPFLRNVTRGRGVPDERLAEVAGHYRHFGGVSPLNAANRKLVGALRDTLDLPVYWGNRNWHPLVADTVRQMRDDGVRRALAFATSAYASYSACRQYLEDIDRARAEVGEGAPEIDKIRHFFDHPLFVAANADAVRDALRTLPDPDAARLVCTAHSIPAAMARAAGPGGGRYEAQLAETARLVAAELGRGPDEVDLVWQSRSGPPQVPWLEPDINDHLEALAGRGVRAVVVAPIGFVSDHVEVIWDLDTEARQTAERLGLGYARAATAGTDPRFVTMVGELAAERRDRSCPRRALSPLGPSHDFCPAGCCPVRGEPVPALTP